METFTVKNIIHFKMDKFSSVDIDEISDIHLSLEQYFKAKEKP